MSMNLLSQSIRLSIHIPPNLAFLPSIHRLSDFDLAFIHLSNLSFLPSIHRLSDFDLAFIHLSIAPKLVRVYSAKTYYDTKRNTTFQILIDNKLENFHQNFVITHKKITYKMRMKILRSTVARLLHLLV